MLALKMRRQQRDHSKIRRGCALDRVSQASFECASVFPTQMQMQTQLSVDWAGQQCQRWLRPGIDSETP